RTRIDGFDMAAGDVGKQRAVRRGRGWWRQDFAQLLRRGKPAGQQSNRRRFHITLAAGDLARKAQARLGVEAQGSVEQFRGIEEGIAMQPTEPRELGLFEAGNGAENADLLAMPKFGLEADH